MATWAINDVHKSGAAKRKRKLEKEKAEKASYMNRTLIHNNTHMICIFVFGLVCHRFIPPWSNSVSCSVHSRFTLLGAHYLIIA